MDVLTREQAIKRIKDLMGCRQIDHLDSVEKILGAIAELMMIFDIKEDELK